MELVPCVYREMGDEGRLCCEKIEVGDKEVSAAICKGCPVPKINCEHLRFSLRKEETRRLVVRWGNGQEEVWGDEPDRVALERGGCAEKVIPVAGPGTCAGCGVREAVMAEEREEVAAQMAAMDGEKVLVFPGRQVAAG